MLLISCLELTEYKGTKHVHSSIKKKETPACSARWFTYNAISLEREKVINVISTFERLKKSSALPTLEKSLDATMFFW